MYSYKTWSKFSITKRDGSVLNCRILEVPEEGIDDVVDFFNKYFVKEESTMRAAGIPESQEAMEEVVTIFKGLIKSEPNSITICCLDNDGVPIIIGASMMVETKYEETTEELDLTIKTKEVQKLFELIGYMMENTHKLISNLKVDVYFDGKGVVVHPEYRGCGIARELLKVRRLVCKERGVPITNAWMTAFGTQRAAERDGWKTGHEVDYEEYGKLYGVTFTNVPPTCKLMFARITN